MNACPGNHVPDRPWLEHRLGKHWHWHMLVLGVSAMALVTGLALSKRARINTHLSKAEQQASGIHKALMLYAHDHDGKFPAATRNANEAFRQLFPEYLKEERYFHVPGSAWHEAAPGRKPDDDIGQAPEYPNALERGENHWAYVSGLDIKSPSTLPLIADGFVEDETGRYTDAPTLKGGVWKGRHAIVVHTSGSVRVHTLSAKTGFRVLEPAPGTSRSRDVFALPATVLNPE